MDPHSSNSGCSGVNYTLCRVPTTCQAITRMISFPNIAYSSNCQKQTQPGHVPKVTALERYRLKPGLFACQPLGWLCPTRLGWGFQAGESLGVLEDTPRPTLQLAHCPPHAASVLRPVLGWSCGLPSQAARLMEASSATCCQLPRRHPMSAGQTASNLPLKECPVTADKWLMSFSHILLIAGLWPELSRLSFSFSVVSVDAVKVPRQ